MADPANSRGHERGWYLAALILGHEQPFVAPIATVISLGATAGRSGRRAVEWFFGLAFGLAVADLIMFAVGTGPLQIGAVAASMLVGQVCSTALDLLRASSMHLDERLRVSSMAPCVRPQTGASDSHRGHPSGFASTAG